MTEKSKEKSAKTEIAVEEVNETTEVKAPKAKKEVKPAVVGGIVVSRVNFPVTVKYGAEEVIVPPRARRTFTDKSKIVVRPQDAKNVRIISA